MLRPLFLDFSACARLSLAPPLLAAGAHIPDNLACSSRRSPVTRATEPPQTQEWEPLCELPPWSEPCHPATRISRQQASLAPPPAALPAADSPQWRAPPPLSPLRPQLWSRSPAREAWRSTPARRTGRRRRRNPCRRSRCTRVAVRRCHAARRLPPAAPPRHAAFRRSPACARST